MRPSQTSPPTVHCRAASGGLWLPLTTFPPTSRSPASGCQPYCRLILAEFLKELQNCKNRYFELRSFSHECQSKLTADFICLGDEIKRERRMEQKKLSNNKENTENNTENNKVLRSYKGIFTCITDRRWSYFALFKKQVQSNIDVRRQLGPKYSIALHLIASYTDASS